MSRADSCIHFHRRKLLSPSLLFNNFSETRSRKVRPLTDFQGQVKQFIAVRIMETITGKEPYNPGNTGIHFHESVEAGDQKWIP